MFSLFNLFNLFTQKQMDAALVASDYRRIHDMKLLQEDSEHLCDCLDKRDMEIIILKEKLDKVFKALIEKDNEVTKLEEQLRKK